MGVDHEMVDQGVAADAAGGDDGDDDVDDANVRCHVAARPHTGHRRMCWAEGCGERMMTPGHRTHLAYLTMARRPSRQKS